ISSTRLRAAAQRVYLCGCARCRDLHSFPTRRSSDLSSSASPDCRNSCDSALPPARASSPQNERSRCPGVGPPPKARITRALRGRSEEHTSELQSRENLVCRLLLEKKKNDNSVTLAYA